MFILVRSKVQSVTFLFLACPKHLITKYYVTNIKKIR